MSMKAISLKGMSLRAGSGGGRGVVMYINILLLIVAVVVAGFLVREYGRGGTASLSGQGMSVAGAYNKGDGARAFADYAIIGRSGLLGESTAIRLIHKRAFKSRSVAVIPSAVNAGAALLGTVTEAAAGGEEKSSAAVFKNKGTGEEEIVRRGDKVFNIGRLVSVSRYSAVVESGGRLLTFNMDIHDKAGAMVKGPLRHGVREGMLFGAGFGVNPSNSAVASSLAKSLGEGKWLVDRRALENSLKDSSRLLQDARFYPYRKGGVVRGFLLSQVRPYGVFHALGLRSGDIILRVNDYKIDSPEKAVSLMKGLKGETDVSVNLMRRGKAQTYTYEIR